MPPANDRFCFVLEHFFNNKTTKTVKVAQVETGGDRSCLNQMCHGQVRKLCWRRGKHSGANNVINIAAMEMARFATVTIM